jgi:hypothetical protein
VKLLQPGRGEFEYGSGLDPGCKHFQQITTHWREDNSNRPAASLPRIRLQRHHALYRRCQRCQFFQEGHENLNRIRFGTETKRLIRDTKSRADVLPAFNGQILQIWKWDEFTPPPRTSNRRQYPIKSDRKTGILLKARFQ